ncbi:hypothetical protein [Terriglobus aquaticus]|uniref:Uncharacterized protein n=1 Tax=Terriglobus aquaticus TaxID=940139 RepID=A0ABW9KLN4_9BACT|nr:hypothetical protein [Terriglobus aquaticus]
MQTQLQMCSRGLFLLFVAAITLTVPLSAQSGCGRQTLEGEVRQGQAWQHTLSPALDLKLEAVPAGWMIRVLPHNGQRPPHDAAELANPPYRSPTPILISTDFSFRAQDAVAWNPRTFRFFPTAAETAKAEALYQASLRDPQHPAAVADLYPLIATAPEATLRITDAEIVGGTANQTAAAATVASHLEQTAHIVRTDLAPSPLGTLLRLRFRIDVPAFATNCHGAAPGVRPSLQ